MPAQQQQQPVMGEAARVAILPPALDRGALQPTEAGTVAGTEKGSTLQELLLERANLQAFFIPQVTWRSCLFEHCSFQELKARRSDFSDVVFVGCDLSNADLRDCVFNKVRFEGCRLTGTNFSQSGLHDVLFTGCTAHYTSLMECKINGLLFERCRLSDVSFNLSAGKRYGFTACALTGIDFRGMKLAGLDLSDNEIAAATWGERELKGALVSPEQACDIARLWGVEIL